MLAQKPWLWGGACRGHSYDDEGPKLRRGGGAGGHVRCGALQAWLGLGLARIVRAHSMVRPCLSVSGAAGSPPSTGSRGHPQLPAPPRRAARRVVTGVGPDIEVEIPADPRQRFVVDAVAFYVMRDGTEFEQVALGWAAGLGSGAGLLWGAGSGGGRAQRQQPLHELEVKG